MTTPFHPATRVRFSVLQRVRDSFTDERVSYEGTLVSLEDDGKTAVVQLDNGKQFVLALAALDAVEESLRT